MWIDLWKNYGGRAIGIIAGLFFGILYLFVGLWNMLFIALLVWIGYQVGKHRDTGSGPLFPWQRMSEWVIDRFRSFR